MLTIEVGEGLKMTDVFQAQDGCYLHLPKWQQKHPNLVAGFTTKNGGFSHEPYTSLNLGLHVNDDYETVISNRKLLADKISIQLHNWVIGDQPHQTEIHLVLDDDRGKGAYHYETGITGVDGLITNQHGLLCTACFADCVPLYFFDPFTEYIGIAHAGWKGTVQKIAAKMVEKLISVGVKTENLLVAIGPCISGEKYVVDDNVINYVDEDFKESCVKHLGKNSYLLNLRQLNVEILLQSGVIRNNIDVTNYCTFTNNTLFFSHRRDKGKTGRMLGFIGYNKTSS